MPFRVLLSLLFCRLILNYYLYVFIAIFNAFRSYKEYNICVYRYFYHILYYNIICVAAVVCNMHILNV